MKKHIKNVLINTAIICSVLLIVNQVRGETIPLEGQVSVLSNFDFKGDPQTELQNLGLKSDTDNTYFYGVVTDTADTEFDLREVYVNFDWQDVTWAAGKVQVPFGFMDLDQPTNSVHIVIPRKNYNDFGLHASTNYDIINVEAAYVNKNTFSFKGIATLFEGGDVFSVSYRNRNNVSSYSQTTSEWYLYRGDDGIWYEDEREVQEIVEFEETIVEWSINNEFYYESVLFNMSNVIEYLPSTKEFWTRFVFAPGVLDVAGLTLGYYNLDSTYQTLWEYELDNDLTYGAYMNLTQDLVATLEWKSNAKFTAPTIKFASTF